MLAKIHLDRDSVHACDDLDSHATTVEADLKSDVGTLLKILKSTYLPEISGGLATWIVSCSGIGPTPLGVMAQQWQEPRLRVPAETSLGDLLGCGRLSITFEYWSQQDPAIVFERISAGMAPPPKW
jgi:hypothetical protein